MERGTLRAGFLASCPRAPALSNPTKAKMASTIPTTMPPGLNPLRVSWDLSKTLPLCT
jgi:hypothetical protein